MAINLSGISLTSDVTGGGGVSGGVTAKIKLIPVTTLPNADEAKKTAVYLVPAKNATSKNKYDEYVVLQTKTGYIWEPFGQDVSVDLQSFATKTDLAKKQDKLVNQQNIRSVNGVPLVGAGNINFEVFASSAEKKKVLDFVENGGDIKQLKDTAMMCQDITGYDMNQFLTDGKVNSVKISNGNDTYTYSKAVYYGGGYTAFDISKGGMEAYEVFGNDRRFRGLIIIGIGAGYQAMPSSIESMYPVDSEQYNEILGYVEAAMTNRKVEQLHGDVEYLENVTRRGTMEVWHAIIDYTKRFDVRATGSTVVARFAVNPYNPKPQHQFIIPSYDVTDGVKVRMKICSDAACTNVIAEEGEMVEFAAGTFVYVKYDLYYNSSVLGMKVKFAAKDSYGDYVGEKIETLSPVTLFCESDYVTPMSGDIKVHCLGGMLTAAGKMFGSDYRYLSKLTIDGVQPSGSGNISSVNVGNDFVIHVNASADNLGDTINIRVGNASLDVFVSNDISPEYVDYANVYDLVPKTWEITFNSIDEFVDAMSQSKEFTLPNFVEDVQIGDKILGHIIEGSTTLDFAVDVTFAQKVDGISIAGTTLAIIGPEIAGFFLTASGNIVEVQVLPMS